MVHRQLRPLQTAGRRELLAWLLGRRRRFRVAGRSMLPTLEPGDVVLAARRQVRCGDVVVIRHPSALHGVWVKRVRELSELQVFVVGDNLAESSDSRTHGRIALDDVLGVVTSTLPR